MPAPASNATLRRDGDALVFTGALLRDAVPALWRGMPASLDGVAVLDVTAVDRVDSAGLALLAEIRARCAKAGDGACRVSGNPAGLSELCAAYRLTGTLDFTTA